MTPETGIIYFFVLLFFTTTATTTQCNETNQLVIRNRGSQLVLDASESLVKLQIYTGLPAQLWSLEKTCSGSFTIINTGNGLALDIVYGPKLGDVQTYPIHAGLNQQWYINSDGTIASGDGVYALEIADGNFVPGSPIISNYKRGDLNQQFRITDKADLAVSKTMNILSKNKYIVIKNPSSGLVLDATGPIVQIQNFTGISPQLWSLSYAKAGRFWIVNKGNGKVLDVAPNNGTVVGSKVITRQKNGEMTQEWSLNGDNTIVYNNTDYVLDITSKKFIPGNDVQVWKKSKGDQQIFVLEDQ